ncbi:hypothetical protein MLD38_017746 [Melastoma candidum]|uniref:Uncharacterized protein n=1 Tax=Melastoma candidum TaxID=119954 RepID=A0ACB9QSY6_9MYRT|nr:hypothetical protein MLD38_017746 [Melastoma candidum]
MDSGLLLLLLLFSFHAYMMTPCWAATNVSYDRRSLIIDGHPKLLMSASIHYPRSSPGMWPGLVQTAKAGGIDVIESYVFWNGHEPSPGKYHFQGRYDLVKFVKTVQQAGLYMILRIGPFVQAEWYYGGIPIWLHYVPGTVFRTDSEPFKYHMQKFTSVIVSLMKQEKLFASQGGPIILSQIENEYGDIEAAYAPGSKPYMLWAAKMAVLQNIGVPWIMCRQEDAPEPMINTCNGFYCDQFTPNSPNKPKMWTENWPGWFKTFGSWNPHRPVEDVAFSVARFFQKGGSLQNYYMYHGGTNFGRTNGGPFITTSYDYEAPIDEYGLPRLPKWGHLKELHLAIKSCEKALLSYQPVTLSLGPSLEADVYKGPGGCAAFIANSDVKEDKVALFQGMSYNLPAWSVSILPDCKNVVFNTAKVRSQSSTLEMVPEELLPSSPTPDKGLEVLKWEVFTERAGIWGKPDFTRNYLVEQLNTTKYDTDYLWYTTSIYVDQHEDFLKSGALPVLEVESKGHGLHAFVNQKLQGSGFGNGTKVDFHFSHPISLKAGKNEIALLSLTVGLQNGGPFYESRGAGPTSVKIIGLKKGILDLTTSSWTYKVGLEGELSGIYAASGISSPKWVSTSSPPKNQPLTWYKATVKAPSGTEPVGLDMISMGKGLAWLNGEPIGIYWPVKVNPQLKCVKGCDYRGPFFPDKCVDGCEEPSQRWYHVPRSWFKPSGNTLVILEETGGDPTQITFAKRKTSKEPAALTALVTVMIPSSQSVVEKLCLDKNECTIEVKEEIFGKKACPGSTRKLAIEASCR